jgi:Na+/proline symporter
MTDQKVFEASIESKAKAKQLRIFAFIAWILAMAGQAFAILKLISDETLVWLIVVIVVILALAITGSLLWKKANRLDPASEKDKAKFFIQNQLGAIMGMLAFLPLVILIFMNKNIDGKTKGIAGAVAIVAMLAAGITGVDFDPPSIEKYTQEINEQTSTLKKLNFDNDNVYCTKAGNKYHIFEDCQHIKGREVITNGTVKESWEKKGISELCKTCEKRAMKERNISE